MCISTASLLMRLSALGLPGLGSGLVSSMFDVAADTLTPRASPLAVTGRRVLCVPIHAYFIVTPWDFIHSRMLVGGSGLVSNI